MMEVLEGVQQFKNYFIVHSKDQKHNRKLEVLLKRLEENGITLKREKCELGQLEACWLGMIYNEQKMSIDLKKTKGVMEWCRPEEKKAVNGFLQTAQFCVLLMRPG